ncbi:hypothetical protein HDU88_000380 [Geranomyces variabilis]|nr:hypothetical protein HDU88_000380 [Geranomyces variabilis]
MMGLNYNKWDSLDAYSSDSEDSDSEANRSKIAATLRLKSLAADDTRPKGLLLTVPWDSNCEAVRWALDRHGINYVEESYPWGLHLWATLEYSDPMPKAQQCKVPVFMSGKGEVLKRSPTDIFTYLFAHSLSSNIRLYTPPSALDLQTYFDETLAPAARTIFLHTVLFSSSPRMSQKYLIEPIHLNTWKALGTATWPLMRTQLIRKYAVTDAAVDSAWKTVEEVFDRVGHELVEQVRVSANIARTAGDRKHPPYICGGTITAADIVFASHAIPVLFANNDVDEFASSIRLLVPPMSALPPALSARVRALRASRAGQHAIRMYRRERGQSFASQQSRYSAVNNPWWVDSTTVLTVLAVVLTTIATVVGLLIWRFGLLTAGVVVLAVLGSSAIGTILGGKGTVCETRARQLWFIRFGHVVDTSLPANDRGGLTRDDAKGLHEGIATAHQEAGVSRAAESVEAAAKNRVTPRAPGGTAAVVAAAKERMAASRLLGKAGAAM